jgi:hypothetical protein
MGFNIKLSIYKGDYIVMSDGTMKRITKTGKIVNKPVTVTPQNNGYVRTTIHRRNEYIHRIVASVFIGDPTGFDVDHIDGNKENNDISNLEIITHKENVRRRDLTYGGSLYERALKNRERGK